MKNSKLVNKITNAYVMLIYVFVFIPVIVMVAFSFNSLPSNQHWESFTLDYYSKLFSDSEMVQVLINSLTLAVVSTLAAIFIGTLGANQIYTFIHIICPMILPGIFTGGLMAFSLSFDDLIVSNFLSNTGYTTLPVKIYSNLKVGISPEYNALFTIILAVMLIATAAIAIKKKRGK